MDAAVSGIDRAAPQRNTLPAAFRRARESLEAHAADPLDLEELARQSGIGIRSLQLDDRFHETGIDGTGSMLVDSSFETERGVVSWQDGVRRSSWR
jgi:hypothetical protein